MQPLRPDHDVVAHKLEVLGGHCEADGRDPAEIEKTILFGTDPLPDTDAFFTAMEAYTALGVEMVVIAAAAPDPAGWVEQVSERVLPVLRDL